jgi:hypothetical protein
MDAILLVVNQFLKFAKMVSTKMTMTTFEMTIFFNMWVRHHGMLQFIVSNDHDAKFTTNFWRHLFRKVEYYLLRHFIHKQMGKWKRSLGCRIGISKIMWMLIKKIGGTI